MLRYLLSISVFLSSFVSFGGEDWNADAKYLTPNNSWDDEIFYLKYHRNITFNFENFNSGHSYTQQDFWVQLQHNPEPSKIQKFMNSELRIPLPVDGDFTTNYFKVRKVYPDGVSREIPQKDIEVVPVRTMDGAMYFAVIKNPKPEKVQYEFKARFTLNKLWRYENVFINQAYNCEAFSLDITVSNDVVMDLIGKNGVKDPTMQKNDDFITYRYEFDECPKMTSHETFRKYDKMPHITVILRQLAEIRSGKVGLYRVSENSWETAHDELKTYSETSDLIHKDGGKFKKALKKAKKQKISDRQKFDEVYRYLAENVNPVWSQKTAESAYAVNCLFSDEASPRALLKVLKKTLDYLEIDYEVGYVGAAATGGLDLDNVCIHQVDNSFFSIYFEGREGETTLLFPPSHNGYFHFNEIPKEYQGTVGVICFQPGYSYVTTQTGYVNLSTKGQTGSRVNESVEMIFKPDNRGLLVTTQRRTQGSMVRNLPSLFKGLPNSEFSKAFRYKPQLELTSLSTDSTSTTYSEWSEPLKATEYYKGRFTLEDEINNVAFSTGQWLHLPFLPEETEPQFVWIHEWGGVMAKYKISAPQTHTVSSINDTNLTINNSIGVGMFSIKTIDEKVEIQLYTVLKVHEVEKEEFEAYQEWLSFVAEIKKTGFAIRKKEL
ncbi:MAG: hypothetical protein SchgKO_12080 [Schleiferiaceae bacterium]